MLSPMTSSQMMSFVIKTVNDKIIVVDGGTAGDAQHLVDWINQLKKEKMVGSGVKTCINAWFLSHLHYDHTGALADILSNQDRYNVEICNIYYQFPPEDWVKQNEPTYFDDILNINQALSRCKYNKLQTHKFEKIDIDGICFMPLNDIDLTITNNAVNNTSIVYKVTMSNGKTVLFLGDAGYEIGNKILN